MMRTIFFDMDGTIADLYGVADWLPQLINSDPTPYKAANPMVNMDELTTICTQLQKCGFRIGVISWLSKGATKEYKAAIRQAKKEWLQEQFNKIVKR